MSQLDDGINDVSFMTSTRLYSFADSALSLTFRRHNTFLIVPLCLFAKQSTLAFYLPEVFLRKIKDPCLGSLPSKPRSSTDSVCSFFHILGFVWLLQCFRGLEYARQQTWQRWDLLRLNSTFLHSHRAGFTNIQAEFTQEQEWLYNGDNQGSWRSSPRGLGKILWHQQVWKRAWFKGSKAEGRHNFLSSSPT